jgi:hypothetical protein
MDLIWALAFSIYGLKIQGIWRSWEDAGGGARLLLSVELCEVDLRGWMGWRI